MKFLSPFFLLLILNFNLSTAIAVPQQNADNQSQQEASAAKIRILALHAPLFIDSKPMTLLSKNSLHTKTLRQLYSKISSAVGTDSDPQKSSRFELSISLSALDVREFGRMYQELSVLDEAEWHWSRFNYTDTITAFSLMDVSFDLLKHPPEISGINEKLLLDLSVSYTFQIPAMLSGLHFISNESQKAYLQFFMNRLNTRLSTLPEALRLRFIEQLNLKLQKETGVLPHQYLKQYLWSHKGALAAWLLLPMTILLAEPPMHISLPVYTLLVTTTGIYLVKPKMERDIKSYVAQLDSIKNLFQKCIRQSLGGQNP